MCVLHLDSLNLDSPGVCGHVQSGLHVVSYLFPFRQQLVQTLCAQHVPERGGSQEVGGVSVVLHVVDSHGGVADPVVDDSVHWHGHTEDYDYPSLLILVYLPVAAQNLLELVKMFWKINISDVWGKLIIFYLRWDVETNSSQIKLLVSVNTGNDEKYSRTLEECLVI